MNHMRDISGQRFNRLIAIKPDGKYKSGNIKWLCKCDCGAFVHATAYSLKSGEVKSCGCYASERISRDNLKHGGFGTRLYEIWRQMHRRCYGRNVSSYRHYGGRGISVCPEWNDYSVFREWAVSNGYKENLTIDRIDVNGCYCPENCRWATMKEQANNKRNSRKIECNGEVHTISEWADIIGIDQRKLWYLLNKKGLDIEAVKGAIV